MNEIRHPIVAGQFYPASKQECIEELNDCLTQGLVANSLPKSIVAGIVPHAGWVFSGSTAGIVFNSIKKIHANVDTFILFGAAHYQISEPSIYESGSWLTPLGKSEIDSVLATQILENSKVAISSKKSHNGEHSIEVQIPFIQYLFPNSKIVPIITPPSSLSIQMGEEISGIISENPDKKIICIGSTDLTHYGPRYGFSPAGVGQIGIDWAKKENDKKFLEFVLELDAPKLLEHAHENYSACGAGAAAAAVSVAKELGKTKGCLLAHTTSSDIMKIKFNQKSSESVGYAGVVF